MIFLGGGPAGYVGAIRAAQLGSPWASSSGKGSRTCARSGGASAKALLESAVIADRVKHAKDFGVDVGEVTTDHGVAMSGRAR